MYGQLFRQADSDSVGVVTGEVAVKFFEKTRLDSRILGEVSSAERPSQRAACLVLSSEADWRSWEYRYGRSRIRRTGASSRPPASASLCG